MKFFLIVVTGERNDTTLNIIAANNADEAFGKFLDDENFDLEDEQDKNLVNDMLFNFPIGIAELPELPTLNENFHNNIHLKWYFAVD